MIYRKNLFENIAIRFVIITILIIIFLKRENYLFALSDNVFKKNSDFSKVDIFSDRIDPPVPISELSFHDSDGATHSFSEYKEYKKIILFFWSSWSIESILGLQSLNRLQLRLERDQIKNVKILPLLMDDDVNFPYIKSLFTAYGIDKLPLLIDKYNSALQTFDAVNPPLTVFLDKDFIITYYSSENIEIDSEGNYIKMVKND